MLTATQTPRFPVNVHRAPSIIIPNLGNERTTSSHGRVESYVPCLALFRTARFFGQYLSYKLLIFLLDFHRINTKIVSLVPSINTICFLSNPAACQMEK